MKPNFSKAIAVLAGGLKVRPAQTFKPNPHLTAKSKAPAHGGSREGAGAPAKDPSAGARVMWTGRLHPDTVAMLRHYAQRGQSQSGIIDEAVERMFGRLWDKEGRPRK